MKDLFTEKDILSDSHLWDSMSLTQEILQIGLHVPSGWWMVLTDAFDWELGDIGEDNSEWMPVCLSWLYISIQTKTY